MRKLFHAMVVISLAIFLGGAAHAEEWEKYDKPVPTKVIVRVLSHGAKAMNPNTGALVIIRDSATNEVLAKGDCQGATGDGTALMETGYPRKSGKTGLVAGEEGVILKDSGECDKYTSNSDAAMFITTLDLTKPTQVVVQAQGPMMPHHAGAVAVATTWLFPGEDVTGEGIVLELRGLIVDTLASLKESEIDVNDAKDGFSVPFYMTMMCGCPIAPKIFGLSWEAENYKITLQAYYNGNIYHEETTTADKLFIDVSKFRATVPLPNDLPAEKFRREKVKVRIMASEPTLANYGMDEFYVYLNRL